MSLYTPPRGFPISDFGPGSGGSAGPAGPGQTEGAQPEPAVPWFVETSDRLVEVVGDVPVVGEALMRSLRVWLPGRDPLGCTGTTIFGIGGRIATRAATLGALTGAVRGAGGGLLVTTATGPGGAAVAVPPGTIGAYAGARVGGTVSFFTGFAYGSVWGAVRACALGY